MRGKTANIPKQRKEKNEEEIVGYSLGLEEDFELESFEELSRLLDLCEVRRWSTFVCIRLELREGKCRPGPT
jgi:thymidine kinase